MSSPKLLDDIIDPLKRFLCKLHGSVEDHNYEPTLQTLFEMKPKLSTLSDQHIVNLLWTMLEELQNVLDGSGVFPKKMKGWMDQVRPTSTKHTQTDDSVIMTDSKLVQITCSNDEFNRRINSFLKRKRMEVDSFNRHEFCKVYDSPDAISCARTDAVFVPRQSTKSIIKIKRVYNVAGERDTNVIDLDGKKNWPPIHPSSTILPYQKLPQDLKERCKNLHSVVNQKKQINENQNVYDILRDIEGRVVYLESLSPEYFMTPNQTAMTVMNNKTTPFSPLKKDDNNKESPNLTLLDQRIVELQRKLRKKARTMEIT